MCNVNEAMACKYYTKTNKDMLQQIMERMTARQFLINLNILLKLKVLSD